MLRTTFNILSRVARWQYGCCLILLLFVIDADVCAQSRANRDGHRLYVESSLYADSATPTDQKLCENVLHDILACRVNSLSHADMPLRVRRSSSETHSIQPYLSILTGTHAVGVGVHHLLNYTILTTSRLQIGLPSIRITFPFHSFW